MKRFIFDKNYSYKFKRGIYSTSGLYGIISDNNNIIIKTSNINGKSIYLDNSKALITNNSKAKDIISLNNTLVSYDGKKQYGYIIANNSFINFPQTYFDINYKIGGLVYNSQQNQNYSWSSILVSDIGSTSGLYWLNKNQYSFYTNQINTINNTIIKNNELTDETNTVNDILYKNDLINGNNKYVKFVINSNNKNIVNGFSIAKNNNIYKLINNTITQIIFNTNVNISYINQFQFENFKFTNINVNNSNIILKNINQINTLSSYNCNIQTNYYLKQFDNIYVTNIQLSGIQLNFNKIQQDSAYDSSMTVLSSSYYFEKNHHPQYGNRIYSNQTNKIYNRNNTYKYGLQSHTHKSFINNTSLISIGNIFPTQSTVTHEKISNSNYKQLFKETGKWAYQPTNITIGNTFIQQNTNIPVGSIIQFYQAKINNQWLPKVPYGFYQLKEQQTQLIDVDSDQPNSLSYNGLLAQVINLDDKGRLVLPAGKIIQINDTCRIIQIIKYSELIKEKD